MPTVTFVEQNGRRHQVEATVGLSLMRAAVDNSVPGIDADCGGQCACATCHVYVHAPWIDQLPAPSAMERDMLGFTAEQQGNSRLACQIGVTEALSGLVVDMPDGQH